MDRAVVHRGALFSGMPPNFINLKWPPSPERKSAYESRPAKVATAKPKPTPKFRPSARPSRAGARWPKPVPPERSLEIFRRFAEANPHPRSELHYKNPFTLLVAVVLSAQATDAGVNKATPALFAIADTPEKMLALGEDKVRD